MQALPHRTGGAGMRLPLMLAGVVVVVGHGRILYFTGGRFESTDDAYVNAARASISTNVAGRVVELRVHDNQRVHKGTCSSSSTTAVPPSGRSRAKLSNASCRSTR